MRFYRKFKVGHSTFVKKVCGRKAVSWFYWKVFQKLLNLFGKEANALCSDDYKFNSNSLKTELKGLITLTPQNKFTLDAETINLLWEDLIKNKPKVILDFGSGTSTKLFHKYLTEFQPNVGTLITIDQDKEFMSKSLNELNKSNINFFSMHSEINENGYLINKNTINNVVKIHGTIDFVLIDGPYGDWMIRRNTLPSIIDFCSGKCVWFLDDAFRDSEMEILREWRKNPRIIVDGIINQGKGLGIGKIKLLTHEN